MPSFSLKSLWDKDKFEVTCRIGVMAACGFSLSVASIPKVVPPSLALMPGLVVSTISSVLPTLVFIILGAYPTVLCVFISIAIYSTMLLAAASVSDGCLLGVYSAYTLLMTTLYFGKNYSTTSGLANTYIAVGGMFSLSFKPLVNKEGLGVVGDMWTEKGTENPLAIWRNILIAVCWALVCVAVGILIPPWRTSRKMITRGLFPSIFTQVNTVLSGEKVNFAALAKSKASLKGGKVVATTIFEPRVFHTGVDLITPMKAIAVATDEMVFRSLLVLQWKEGMTKSPTEIDSVVLQNSATLLSDCGAALAKDSQAAYNTLLNFVGDKAFDRMSKVGAVDNTAESADPEDSDASFIYKQSLEVRVATLSYLRAFHHGITALVAKQTTMQRLKRAVVYIAVPLIPTIRILKAPFLICKPKQWNFKTIWWCIELSAGFVALMAMSLYWDAYANFRLESEDQYIGAVYSGWQLMGYAFSWRPTHEGTVKKGIQRILGTCLGGFTAWLGIIVCSWSYDNEAEINPYGLVVWLTVFTMINAYFATLPSGVAAHSGKDKDHGYLGMYFSLSMALIALETFLGSGDKNGLTLNRIVATITGVLMAVVISFLPPHINGRDPKYSRDYLDALNDAFIRLLKTFADKDESTKITTDDFKKSLLAPANAKASFALFVLNDADMLQFLPFYKVNKDLRPLLDEMGVTEAMIAHLLEGFATVITKGIHANETRTSVSQILDEIDSYGKTVLQVNPDSGLRSDVTIGWTYDIFNQLEQLSGQLDIIESETGRMRC